MLAQLGLQLYIKVYKSRMTPFIEAVYEQTRTTMYNIKNGSSAVHGKMLSVPCNVYL